MTAAAWYRENWWCCDFFFFFQAEDGIRDLTVTGVQTCALPILPHRYAEDQETQVGRALREGDAARVLWCPQHHYAKDEAEQVVGVAPYREVIEKGDAHVDTPYHPHQPKEWRRDVVPAQDRKSTRLNSSHSQISYAVFCLKKKNAARMSDSTGL